MIVFLASSYDQQFIELVKLDRDLPRALAMDKAAREQLANMKASAAAAAAAAKAVQGLGQGGTQQPEWTPVYDTTNPDGEYFPPLYTKGHGVAIIQVSGELRASGSFWSRLTGRADFETLTAALLAAQADPEVDTVLQVIDSPGGHAQAALQYSDLVAQVNTTKPVHSYFNQQAASAGLMIALPGTSITASPYAVTGSVGAAKVVMDETGALAQAGYKAEIFRSGPLKYAGNGLEPLTDQQRAEVQKEIDAFAGLFFNLAAAKMHIPVAQLPAEVTDGGSMLAADARRLGLVDKLDSYQNTLASLLVAHTATSTGYKFAAPSEGTIMSIAASTQAATAVAQDLKAAQDRAAAAESELAVLKAAATTGATTITELQASLAQVQSALAQAQAQAATVPALTAIVATATERMRTGLGLAQVSLASLPATDVLREYESVRPVFESKYPVGGVAQTSTNPSGANSASSTGTAAVDPAALYEMAARVAAVKHAFGSK